MKKNILVIALLSGAVMASGALQAQEQTRERPTFAMLDSNGDGSLTQDEMDAQRADRFTNADTNGDGGLSADELIAMSPRGDSDRATQMLTRLDTDEDGLVQESEMQARRGGRSGNIFERLDTDEDGAISLAEFEAAKEMRDDREQRDRG